MVLHTVQMSFPEPPKRDNIKNPQEISNHIIEYQQSGR